jgi:hypothetical protein
VAKLERGYPNSWDNLLLFYLLVCHWQLFHITESKASVNPAKLSVFKGTLSGAKLHEFTFLSQETEQKFVGR